MAFATKRGVWSWFSWSLDLGNKMAEFPLPLPKFENLKNELLFKPSWWIFMNQNVNIIAYIWSPNWAMCTITKIGCTQLWLLLTWRQTEPENQLSRHWSNLAGIILFATEVLISSQITTVALSLHHISMGYCKKDVTPLLTQWSKKILR